jgi:hypothetical protein
MEIRKRLLLTLGICGLALAERCSVIGQEPTSNPTLPAPATALDLGDRYEGPAYAIGPTTTTTIRSGGIYHNNDHGGYYSQINPSPSPMIAMFGQPTHTQELMVFVDGKFKVLTEDINNVQNQEAANTGRSLLNEATQTLRADNASEEKRAEAKKIVTQYLEAHFDHDQNKRREQLESLEAQVVKLKAQLEKRAKSKDQLIELRLTILENDASGLSFPPSWAQMPGPNQMPQVGQTLLSSPMPPPTPGFAVAPAQPGYRLPPAGQYQPTIPRSDISTPSTVKPRR